MIRKVYWPCAAKRESVIDLLRKQYRHTMHVDSETMLQVHRALLSACGCKFWQLQADGTWRRV